MRRDRVLSCMILILLLAFCARAAQSAAACGEPAFVRAFSDFLLHTDIDPNYDFPIWGYYLFDLNFDGIPELGVLHDSGGSMGGYFTYYCFDGKDIVPVPDAGGDPAVCSNYTQILADLKSKRMYALKEMYLLAGNHQGTVGYVNEIRNEKGIPRFLPVLYLTVGQIDDNSFYSKPYGSEDEFLSDPELDGCLVTQYYSEGAWEEVSSEEYFLLKRQLIPKDHSFVDVRNTDAYVLLCGSVWELMDENLEFHNRRITEEQIDALFAAWFDGAGGNLGE